ncbi:MAG: rhodanese-like domain-containing protein [Planctomycetota bacterium]
MLPTVLSAAALAVALLALLRRNAALAAEADPGRDARQALGRDMQKLEAQLALHQRLLERLAEGGNLTPEMLAEGQFWQDVDGAAAQGMHADGAACWLDVRTSGEVARGCIPGALWIPMDQIQARLAELPRDKALVVYCASGGRSVAVCEFLSQQGFPRLFNLESGIGGWAGPIAPHQAPGSQQG